MPDKICDESQTTYMDIADTVKQTIDVYNTDLPDNFVQNTSEGIIGSASYAKGRGLSSHTMITHTSAATVSELFPMRSRDEYLRDLKDNATLFRRYSQLSRQLQARFVDFMTGKRTLPLAYDPFFKKIFNPDVHADRLSSLISCIIGQEVTVKCALSNEESLLPTSSMLIMDILVELTDGSVANVEIQKIPYAFQEERISCYSADLLLRQYSRVKGERGKDFTYKDLKKVYTIVLFEESPSGFKSGKMMGKYRHVGRGTFDTGLEMDLLQEYFLIALDVFGKNKYSEDRSTLHAWLSLLTAHDTESLCQLISDYPWMEEVCRDIAEYLYKPEEVLAMFSDALRILDQNTAMYMVDELNRRIEEAKQQIEEARQENRALMAEKDNTIAENNALLAEKDKALAENKMLLETEKAENERLRAELERLKHGTA